MRIAWLALAGAVALAGCDSAGVPGPADKDASTAGESAAAATLVDLRADGLAAGSESFYFAAGRKEVEGALARALGPALRSGENGECGAGPMTFVDFAGGLTAHFQDGKLVGWNWHGPQDGDTAPTGTIKAAGPVQLGSARSAVEAAPGFAKVENSTLGEEFALGEAVGGFVAGDKVEMLYAGTQCFFR